VAPCIVVGGCQRFRGPYSLPLRDVIEQSGKMHATGLFITLLSSVTEFLLSSDPAVSIGQPSVFLVCLP
jgi:hypothetical protein